MYKIGASSSGHELSKDQTVVITDGQTNRLTLALDRTASRLGFEVPTRNWTPQESPILPLHGLLQTHTVGVTVDRLNMEQTLARRPDLLAGPEDRASDDEGPDRTPRWQGQFSPVRHWTYPITRADAEGAFVERVPLGPLPPGMYRVTAHTHEGGEAMTATGWALVTSLALVRKTFGGQMLAYVTDIATGRPVANAAVSLYDQVGNAGKRLRQARTSVRMVWPDFCARRPGGKRGNAGGPRGGVRCRAAPQNLNSPGSETKPRKASTASGRSCARSCIPTGPCIGPARPSTSRASRRWFDPRAGLYRARRPGRDAGRARRAGHFGQPSDN